MAPKIDTWIILCCSLHNSVGKEKVEWCINRRRRIGHRQLSVGDVRGKVRDDVEWHFGSPYVRLTALSARNTAPIEGTVISVSADRLIDENSGQPYYLARIWLTGDLAGQLNGETLYPGMPAEVMIVTGARTALEYIFQPISDSLNRSFRQQ